MSIYGVGADIVEVSRLEDIIKNYGENFLNRIFTDFEQPHFPRILTIDNLADSGKLSYCATKSPPKHW